MSRFHPRRLVAVPAMALLLGMTSVLSHHPSDARAAGVVLSGTHSGGGGVALTLQDDGAAIIRLTITGIPACTPADFDVSYPPPAVVAEVHNGTFRYAGWPELIVGRRAVAAIMEGTVDMRQASGTLRFADPRAVNRDAIPENVWPLLQGLPRDMSCDSGVLQWSASVDGEPVAPPAAQGAAVQSAPPAPGTVLLRDRFDDPARSAFPLVSPDPARLQVQFRAGGYVVSDVVGGWLPAQFSPGRPLRFIGIVPATGTYTDTEMQVDAGPVDVSLSWTLGGHATLLACRMSADGKNGYIMEFGITPARSLRAKSLSTETEAQAPALLRTVRLSRLDGGVATVLDQWVFDRTVRPANRLGLICSGDVIAATVNGVLVAGELDSTYRAGASGLGVSFEQAVTAIGDTPTVHPINVLFSDFVLVAR